MLGFRRAKFNYRLPPAIPNRSSFHGQMAKCFSPAREREEVAVNWGEEDLENRSGGFVRARGKWRMPSVVCLIPQPFTG